MNWFSIYLKHQRSSESTPILLKVDSYKREFSEDFSLAGSNYRLLIGDNIWDMEIMFKFL